MSDKTCETCAKSETCMKRILMSLVGEVVFCGHYEEKVKK